MQAFCSREALLGTWARYCEHFLCASICPCGDGLLLFPIIGDEVSEVPICFRHSQDSLLIQRMEEVLKAHHCRSIRA